MMNEESKELARDRMKKYWADVKAGRREHPTPGRPKKAEAAPVAEAPTPPPSPTPEKPKISPIAHAEGIHFPMPGVKAEISFMVDKQQPVEPKAKTPPPKAPSEHVGDFKLPTHQVHTEKGPIVRPEVNLVVGRKVAVKFTPKKQGTPSKVIMQFGRRRRLPGDL